MFSNGATHLKLEKVACFDFKIIGDLSHSTCNLRRSAKMSQDAACAHAGPGKSGGFFFGRFQVNAEHVTCWFRIFGSWFWT